MALCAVTGNYRCQIPGETNWVSLQYGRSRNTSHWRVRKQSECFLITLACTHAIKYLKWKSLKIFVDVVYDKWVWTVRLEETAAFGIFVLQIVCLQAKCRQVTAVKMFKRKYQLLLLPSTTSQNWWSCVVMRPASTLEDSLVAWINCASCSTFHRMKALFRLHCFYCFLMMKILLGLSVVNIAQAFSTDISLVWLSHFVRRA